MAGLTFAPYDGPIDTTGAPASLLGPLEGVDPTALTQAQQELQSVLGGGGSTSTSTSNATPASSPTGGTGPALDPLSGEPMGPGGATTGAGPTTDPNQLNCGFNPLCWLGALASFLAPYAGRGALIVVGLLLMLAAAFLFATRTEADNVHLS